MFPSTATFFKTYKARIKLYVILPLTIRFTIICLTRHCLSTTEWFGFNIFNAHKLCSWCECQTIARVEQTCPVQSSVNIPRILSSIANIYWFWLQYFRADHRFYTRQKLSSSSSLIIPGVPITVFLSLYIWLHTNFLVQTFWLILRPSNTIGWDKLLLDDFYKCCPLPWSFIWLNHHIPRLSCLTFH